MTEMWKYIEREIEQRIEAARTALEGASGDDVIRLQARIRTLRDVIQIPTSISNKAAQSIGGDDDYFPS